MFRALYATTAKQYGEQDIERLTFGDRIHILVCQEKARTPWEWSCGYEYSKLSFNVDVGFDAFLYYLGRLRRVPLPVQYRASVFPVSASIAEDFTRIDIGVDGFTLWHHKHRDRKEELRVAWEDYWDNA